MCNLFIIFCICAKRQKVLCSDEVYVHPTGASFETEKTNAENKLEFKSTFGGSKP